jgi:hopanoid biosynthesis associated RND transporter like protein HpnN
MSVDFALVRLVCACARHARAVVLCAACLGLFALFLAVTRLGMTTSLDGLFDARLPWKQSESALKLAYPQFTNLIVAVIDAPVPEEAEATAAALAADAARDHRHFLTVRRPDTSPYLKREGLLFLDPADLQDLLDKTVDAAPFLGQLAADPSARGLFNALGLIGQGVQHGQADLTGFAPALARFDATIAGALHGKAAPLSWQSLLGGKLAELAGPDRIVLIQPRLDYTGVEPGGAATAALRALIARLPEVASGAARVRLTGDVPLQDTEFASAAKGAVIGLALSFGLVVLWLFLALRRARLILPVVLTLLLGLILTTGFAALAVGTLNLISVAFAILFVGIAVDFSIQFTVRFRDMRRGAHDIGAALKLTAGRVGWQILIAAGAIAAGFLAFVPTSFKGVAELGLVAGAGMIIALACTLTFLPAAIVLFRPQDEAAEIGFARLAVADHAIARWRRPLRVLFLCVFAAGAALTPRLGFDSNALHTQPQNTEAMRTLHHLMANPITNPFTADIVRPSEAQAAALAGPVSKLSLVDHVVGLDSFVPVQQTQKLAMIADAAGVLLPVLNPPPAPPPPDAAALRASLKTALDPLDKALPSLAANSPMHRLTADLGALAQADDATLLRASQGLTRFLPPMLATLRASLGAAPVTLADIPPDIARDYVQPDGAARLEVVPKAAVADSDDLRHFVAQLRTVAPDAGGAAVTLVSTADTITRAFRHAATGAMVAITVILILCLPRRRDAAFVLAPLLVSAAMTVLVVVATGMSLNFANIIALPLLLGVGVSFNIYFVMNAASGEPPLLRSATTRAVLFSALTTGSAFGSLALSAHPGTASMGTLLLISLLCTLINSLVLVPALLGPKPMNFPVNRASLTPANRITHG